MSTELPHTPHAFIPVPAGARPSRFARRAAFASFLRSFLSTAGVLPSVDSESSSEDPPSMLSTAAFSSAIPDALSIGGFSDVSAAVSADVSAAWLSGTSALLRYSPASPPAPSHSLARAQL
eukprot:CAMPEP_0181230034 /NCGR_PEP_ID=MMETSP1096-20121128/34236_1 /TAXON_ID=156174 ORGANISM="Chrysochromulina ericina, Strain CCMP281" /NCGR_SAMPLE_ID=MMETSP1096 /ASSEMBLY_ACC=CAM_ASM_000453 /LENGTH=120 /DNA_ID=CAMNT_0023323739 /DNA_START=130 /DNA_END=489 /DNA_ORIENTATION=-